MPGSTRERSSQRHSWLNGWGSTRQRLVSRRDKFPLFLAVEINCGRGGEGHDGPAKEVFPRSMKEEGCRLLIFGLLLDLQFRVGFQDDAVSAPKYEIGR